jgi:hypothetical protein
MIRTSKNHVNLSLKLALTLFLSGCATSDDKFRKQIEQTPAPVVAAMKDGVHLICSGEATFTTTTSVNSSSYGSGTVTGSYGQSVGTYTGSSATTTSVPTQKTVQLTREIVFNENQKEFWYKGANLTKKDKGSDQWSRAEKVAFTGGSVHVTFKPSKSGKALKVYRAISTLGISMIVEGSPGSSSRGTLDRRSGQWSTYGINNYSIPCSVVSGKMF